MLLLLVLWNMLQVCTRSLRNQQSGSFEIWVTDSWWLFVKLVKTCLSPKHFCVYVYVLTSLAGHALTMINQQCLKLKPCPPSYHQQISIHLPSIKSSSDQRQPWSRLLYTGSRGGGTAAWLCDIWQELQLWSVFWGFFFWKESLAAENAAVSHRFTAQSLQSIPPWILPQSGRRKRHLSALCLRSHTFHYQFIYFIL